MVNVAIKADVSRLLTRVRNKISALEGTDPKLGIAMFHVGNGIKTAIQNRIEETRNKQYYVSRQTGRLKDSITSTLLKSSQGEFQVGVANIKFMDAYTKGHDSQGGGYWRWQEGGTKKKNYQIPKDYRGRILSFYWENPKMSRGEHCAYINKKGVGSKDKKGGVWMSIDKVIHPGINSRNFILTVDGVMHENDYKYIPIFTRVLKKVMEA